MTLNVNAYYTIELCNLKPMMFYTTADISQLDCLTTVMYMYMHMKAQYC